MRAHVEVGLGLLAAGQPFEAHEAFEAAFHEARGAGDASSVSATRALAQLAAAGVKVAEGNLSGRAKLLARAEESVLGAARPCFLGLDLDALGAAIAHAAADETRPLPRLPTRLPERGVVYVHGFASSPASRKARAFVDHADARGWPIRAPDLNLAPPNADAPEGRFDFEGLTVSRGLRAVQRCLFPRTILVGSSLGGYLSLLTASHGPEVEALVLMAPAFGVAERLEARYTAERLAEWAERGAIEVDHFGTGRPERIGHGFRVDARRHPASPPIRVPTYILHGQRDDTVPIALSEPFAAHPLVQFDPVDDTHELVASVDRALAALDRAWG